MISSFELAVPHGEETLEWYGKRKSICTILATSATVWKKLIKLIYFPDFVLFDYNCLK